MLTAPFSRQSGDLGTLILAIDDQTAQKSHPAGAVPGVRVKSALSLEAYGSGGGFTPSYSTRTTGTKLKSQADFRSDGKVRPERIGTPRLPVASRRASLLGRLSAS
jgi:hypothetical protein